MAPLSLGAGPEIKRRRLLGVCQAAQPKILALVAPAGCGKSTLARQVAQQLNRRLVVCDCAGPPTPLEMARRVLAVLAEEAPERSRALAQLTLAVRDSPDGRGTTFSSALTGWIADGAPAAFVFENAEALDDAPAVFDFIAELLSKRPEQRMVVICSRTGLRLNLTRFASSQDVLAFRASDLLFDRDELRAVFREIDAEPKLIERLEELSQGWPIGAQILRALATGPDVRAVLERLHHMPFEELYEYLSDEVLHSYPKDWINALVACAALPDATSEDIGLALGVSAEQILSALTLDSPFLSKTARYTYVVHPLMRASLLARHESKVRALPRAAAEAWRARGAFVRAAQIFSSSGDHEAAAAALNEIEVMETSAFSESYARVLASLSTMTFARYPRLFASSMNYRQYFASPQSLLNETESVHRALARDVPTMQRAYVDYFRIDLSHQLGAIEDARRIAEALAKRAQAPDAPQTSLHAHILLYRGINAALRGRLTEAERLFENAWPLIVGLDQVVGAASISRAALIARVRGRRAEERRLLEVALERCRRAGISGRIARARAETAFGAWLAGDDAEFEQALNALTSCVETEGVIGFAHLLNCARGFIEDAPRGIETPASLAQAYLIASAHCNEAESAMRFARQALAAADQSGVPLLRVLARVAVAERDHSDSEPLLDQAAVQAGAIESPELAAAIASLVKGASHAGMLESFVARLRRHKPAFAAIAIDFASGEVRSRGRAVALRPRELRLLMIVARAGIPVPPERLARTLWPSSDEQSARNALKTTLHRLRQNLGDARAVVTTAQGVGLRDRAETDLNAIEIAVRVANTPDRLDPDGLDRIASAFERLGRDRPSTLEGWEWYETLDRQMSEWRRLLALRMAREALAVRDYDRALQFGRAAIEIDQYDEQPQEVVLRALIGLGDHVAAVRSYRDHCSILKDDLDLEPPARLAALIGSATRV